MEETRVIKSPHITCLSMQGRNYVYDERTGKTEKLDDLQINVLNRINSLGNVDWQVENCRQAMRMPHEASALLHEIIAALAKHGWIAPPPEPRQTPPKKDTQPGRSRISALIWATRDRPDCLEQSLASFIANLAPSGRRPRLIVSDDSRAKRQQDENKAAIAGVSHEHSIDIEYFGYDDRKALIALLISSEKVPRESKKATEFAFLGPDDPLISGLGANRNFCTVLAQGGSFLSIDDDMICRPSGEPALLGTIAIDPGATDWSFEHYDSYDAALADNPLENACVLDTFEQLLGEAPSALLARFGPANVRLRGLDDRCLREVLLGGSARVMLSTGGSYGDAGSDTPHWLLGGDGDHLRKWLSSPERCLTAFQSRLISRRPAALTITRNYSFQSMCFALENSRPLIPFFPLFRDSDGIFSLANTQSNPDFWICNAPFALLHRPPDRSTRFDPGDDKKDFFLTSNFIKLLTLDYRPPVERGQAFDALAGYARYLDSLASLNDRDFWSVGRERIFRASALTVQAYASKFGGLALPVEAARILDSYVRSERDFLATLERSGRELLQSGFMREQREYFRSYAELIHQWPGIRSTAQEAMANLRGIRPD